ncbi:MAG: ECF transporter S component [Promethearchaeota archaeon]
MSGNNDNIPVKGRVINIKDEKTQSKAYKTAIITVMTSLTTVMTMIIAVYIPSSNGFFNIGESMVYLSALLFGPIIGGISGGVGSAIADLFLGYYQYAPGTLVIKGLEGFIVGTLFKILKNTNENKKDSWTRIIIISALVSIAILVIGLMFYIGSAEISGFNNAWSFVTNFNSIIWYIAAISSFIIIILLNSFLSGSSSARIISMFIGGLEMVFGYLLYGSMLYGITAVYVEIPFNILQSLIGIVLTMILIGPIEKVMPKN